MEYCLVFPPKTSQFGFSHDVKVVTLELNVCVLVIGAPLCLRIAEQIY